MKKYVLTMTIMAIFTIGFAASEEEGNSSTPSPTEQKQETEAEHKVKKEQKHENEATRKARERKEKIEKVKENGRYWGELAAQTNMGEQYATGKYLKEQYLMAFGTPSSDEDYKMFEIFKRAYLDAYYKTVKAMSRM